MLPWLVGTAAAMSVIAVYVALAATVFFGRALVGIPGRMWRRLPALSVTAAARTPDKRRVA
ncbi:MAG TPA: hypothetical protein VLI07_05620 [Candidatus Binatus sp.]|nr:hypothetical protein [Candidatus Binatus sp.]